MPCAWTVKEASCAQLYIISARGSERLEQVLPEYFMSKTQKERCTLSRTGVRNSHADSGRLEPVPATYRIGSIAAISRSNIPACASAIRKPT